MNKPQIVLAVAGVLLVILLFRLPRVVVENETESEVEAHDFTVSERDAEAISSLNNQLSSDNSSNSIIFADSLARLYLKYGFADSAYSVVSNFMLEDSSLNALRLSGKLLYTLYERSATAEDMAKRGIQARQVLEKWLEKDPGNLSAKTKLAVTMVTTERPMVGIQMLREVLDEDPYYREAILNLGLLSIRSGQYEKGIGRFSRLIRMNNQDHEAMLFLGVCYLETSKTDSANYWLEKIVASEAADPALQAAAKEYLQN